jgi:hypothetical protein
MIVESTLRLVPVLRIVRIFCVLLALLAAASPAAAAVRHWIGGGADNKWSTPGNWNGGLVPVNGDIVVISPAATTSVGMNDKANLEVASLIINHAYTLTGFAIRLGAGGLDINSLNVSVGAPLILTASQTWTSTVAAATVNSQIGLAGHTVTFDVGISSNLTVQNVISGTGALVKDGVGVVHLSGNNFGFQGPVTVNEGYVWVEHENALGFSDNTAANGTIVKGNAAIGGTLHLAGVDIGNEYLSVEGPGQFGNGALQVNGAPSTIGGTFVAPADVRIRVGAASRLTFAGRVTGVGRLLLVDHGIYEFTNGTNAYSGGLDIGQGGTYATRVTIAGQEGIPNAPQQFVPVNTTLTIQGVRQTVNALAGMGTVQLNTAQSELVVNGSGNSSFAGALSGVGVLRHVGLGSFALLGDTSAMTGKVIVDQGRVIVPTLSMPADMTANAGGQLQLAGTPSVGDLDIHDGRLDLPANISSAATATATSLSVTPGGAVAFGSTDTQISRLNVAGTVSLNGRLDLTLNASFKAAVNTVFTLIANDANDPVTGTFAGLPHNSTLVTPLARFRISYTGGDGNDVTATLVGYGREYLLSEGAIGTFFTTDILVANPNDAPAPIHVSFLKPGGGTVEFDDEVAPMSRKTITANDVAALDVSEFSTVVKSTAGWPLVVERTMTWDRQQGYGAHTERAADAPSTTWYFAEGSQGFFSTFLLLANSNDSESFATVQYLREGVPPVTRIYNVPARSRVTVDAGADPELVNQSFGMVVTFNLPGLAERAMYFGGDPVWKGGHASAGVTAPAPSAFVAEGATGSFFETFVLIANPNSTAVDVTLTFGRQGDSAIQMLRSIPASSRLTLNLEALDPGLANASVSTRVEASQPVIVERAQYWPDPAPQWYEAHGSPALQTAGTKWGLAEGRVGGPSAYQTYILLANPQAADAHVTITFLRETGAPFTKTFTVPATQRLNVQVGPGTDVSELDNERFGALITSDQPIAVERAMYANAGSQVWAAGTSASATPLP